MESDMPVQMSLEHRKITTNNSRELVYKLAELTIDNMKKGTIDEDILSAIALNSAIIFLEISVLKISYPMETDEAVMAIRQRRLHDALLDTIQSNCPGTNYKTTGEFNCGNSSN